MGDLALHFSREINQIAADFVIRALAEKILLGRLARGVIDPAIVGLQLKQRHIVAPQVVADALGHPTREMAEPHQQLVARDCRAHTIGAAGGEELPQQRIALPGVDEDLAKSGFGGAPAESSQGVVPGSGFQQQFAHLLVAVEEDVEMGVDVLIFAAVERRVVARFPTAEGMFIVAVIAAAIVAAAEFARVSKRHPLLARRRQNADVDAIGERKVGRPRHQQRQNARHNHGVELCDVFIVFARARASCATATGAAKDREIVANNGFIVNEIGHVGAGDEVIIPKIIAVQQLNQEQPAAQPAVKGLHFRHCRALACAHPLLPAIAAAVEKIGRKRHKVGAQFVQFAQQ